MDEAAMLHQVDTWLATVHRDLPKGLLPEQLPSLPGCSRGSRHAVLAPARGLAALPSADPGIMEATAGSRLCSRTAGGGTGAGVARLNAGQPLQYNVQLNQQVMTAMAQLRTRLQLGPKPRAASATASATAATQAAVGAAASSWQLAPASAHRAPAAAVSGAATAAGQAPAFFHTVPGAALCSGAHLSAVVASALESGAGARKRPAPSGPGGPHAAIQLPAKQPKRPHPAHNQEQPGAADVAAVATAPPSRSLPVASRPLSSSAPHSTAAATSCDGCETPSAPSAPAPPPLPRTGSGLTSVPSSQHPRPAGPPGASPEASGPACGGTLLLPPRRLAPTVAAPVHEAVGAVVPGAARLEAHLHAHHALPLQLQMTDLARQHGGAPPPQRAAAAAQVGAAHTAAAAAGGTSAQPAMLPAPPPAQPQKHQQLVCALPAPSLTLQELLTQHSAKQQQHSHANNSNKDLHPSKPNNSTAAPATAAAWPSPLPAAAGAAGAAAYRALLDAALRSADPAVVAALQGTAAAAAAQQQEWRSQLPPLDRLLCSWPLAELPAQLLRQPPPGAVATGGRCLARGGGAAGGADAPVHPLVAAHSVPGGSDDVGQGVSGTCGGSSTVLGAPLCPVGTCASLDEESDGESSGDAHGGCGATEPLLQFSCTPFRRRRAEQVLPCCRTKTGGVRGQQQQQQQGASGQPPRLSQTALAAALEPGVCESRGDLWALFCHVMEAQQAEEEAAAAAAEAAAAAGGEAALSGCHGVTGAEEDGEQEGAEDDPDVYVTDEALACLAALGSDPHGRCGWSIPVMVRRRGGGMGTAGAVACVQPDTPLCTPRRDSVGGSGSMDVDDGGTGHGSSCAGEGAGTVCGSGLTGGRTSGGSAAAAPPATLYFGPPLLDQMGLVLASWNRMCSRAMAASAAAAAAGCWTRSAEGERGFGCDNGSGGGSCGAGEGVLEPQDVTCAAADSDSCECCQQDEWRLGPCGAAASLLVLSHCHVAAAAAAPAAEGVGAGAEVEPVQVVALAARGGNALGSDAAAALAAAAAHYPEMAIRAQLLRGGVETKVVVVDPADGALLAEQRLGPGALARLAGPDQVERCWRLAAQLLGWLQRLPPGPYLLRLDLAAQRLELLCGTGRGPAEAQ